LHEALNKYIAYKYIALFFRDQRLDCDSLTEMVRDNALAAAGLLVPVLGGASVHPYQPKNIWNPLNSFYEYPEPTDVPPDEHHRGSLYTFVKRSAPHSGMQIFDFPDRTASSARRRVSNTPLQALELMNDPQFVEAYRVLASHALEKNMDTDAAITTIFRLARRQRPTSEQLALLKEYYDGDGELAHFRTDPAGALSVLKVGVTPIKQGADPLELAALTNVIRGYHEFRPMLIRCVEPGELPCPTNSSKKSIRPAGASC
jgi:Protein of unknown function (DUF1553)